MKSEVCTYQLKTCVWEITLACCFSCKYCGSRAGSSRNNELTTDECLDIAKQISNMGCKRVTLIGGEVFLRKDWQRIAGELINGGVAVSIVTNGYLFSEQLISDLLCIGIESVAVSIDGPEQIHDKYRQKGSFREAINTLDQLIQNDIPVSVITTLHSQNVLTINELYEVLKEKRLFAWQLQACTPMGNALAGSFSPFIDFKDVIRFVEEHLVNAPFAIGVADNIGYYTEFEELIRGDLTGEISFPGCQAGITNIGIDSEGNVRGCESMCDARFIEGNLRNNTLFEIWNNANAFAYNRKFEASMLSGECEICRYSLRCKGGCRSYNFFVHGKMYESPCCALKCW